MKDDRLFCNSRYVRTDVSKDEDVEALVTLTVERFGGVDVMFANAGILGGLGKTGDYPRETWDRVIAVNLGGVFNCMKYACLAMEASGTGGCIISTASTTGLRGFGSHPACV